jgi:hypothetical protein
VILLEFVKGDAAEITEFDDEDEIYVAVNAVVAKIDRQSRSCRLVAASPLDEAFGEVSLCPRPGTGYENTR